MNAITQNSGSANAHNREVFSLEGARVTLDARHGWQCTCAASRADLPCGHIEQAQGLRRRRGEKREADTVELELSAAALRALSEGLGAGEDDSEVPLPGEASNARRPHALRGGWTALLAAVAIAAISSGITYLAVKRAEPIRADQQPFTALRVAPSPQPAAPAQTDVRFVNPFDATEIFNFPPGTSESSAREAVAQFLLKRAQERLSTGDELRRRFSKADDGSPPPTIVAQGS